MIENMMGKHSYEMDWTSETTAGSVKNYTMNYMQIGAQQGWQCPICQRVLSPWTIECPCQGQGKQTYTTTGITEIWKDVPGVSSDGKRN